MLFTPRNDHSRRLADGLPGQNSAARTTPVAPFWPPGLPEGRTGRRGYPGLRHARPEPRRAGQTIETRGQTGARKTAWHKRIGSPMEQPSQLRQRTKKPEPATRPDFAKGQTGQPCRTEQNNHGPKLPANLPVRRALALSSLLPNFVMASPNGALQPPTFGVYHHINLPTH